MEKVVSLNQIGIFNPHRQSAETTEMLFIARRKNFELLMERLNKETLTSIPQHYLIVGQRGMGKTTLLKRMEVELHKEQYRNKFIPLLFPEEQYNLRGLTEFWLNCLDALADSLETEDEKNPKIAEIDNYIEQTKDEKKNVDFAEKMYHFLLSICSELNRRPVLLVDNIGLVFSRLSKHEQDVLRSYLSKNNSPIIVSAGVAISQDLTEYSAPFYDFFQIQYLRKLSFEEVLELLNNLAKVTQTPIDINANQPRLRALHQLTGGNPRTAVMLFRLLVKGFSADISDDLEALLDEITPLYKARFEELSEQQQIIVDAIAMNWDAINLKQLSIATRFENNQLSPQLKRLIDEGLIETTSAYQAKGNAYSISERFFNIWFLMRRSSRRTSKQIPFLSKFLECYYGEDMDNVANKFLEKEHCKDTNEIASSPYFIAIQALEIERTKNTETAEIYLKNQAVEKSEPARMIMEKIRRLTV